MDNPVLDVIEKRRSLRAFSDQVLLEEEKQAILRAAFRAPTAGNMMLYSIIEVADQGLKERLAETCDHQPFIARAPFVLLFLADYQRWHDSFTFTHAQERAREMGVQPRNPEEGDLLLACCDTLIAAQNAVIAAESLGIGSCYIGDILENYEIHRAMFHLPRYVIPLTLLCFGRPAVDHSGRPQMQRYDPQFILHKNTYQRLSPEKMERMFEPMRQRHFSSGVFVEGAENIPQHVYLKKFTAEFSLEMSRSVREMLKNWQMQD